MKAGLTSVLVVLGIVLLVLGVLAPAPVLMFLGVSLIGTPVFTHFTQNTPLTPEEAARGKPLPKPKPEPWCSCGSEEPPVPVEVEYTPGQPEVVAHLCPGCREKRKPKPPRGRGAASIPMVHPGPPVIEALSPGAATPMPPLEVEQGGYIYSFGCVEGDLCVEAHEWESVMAHLSWAPLIELCTRCGVHRRPIKTALSLTATGTRVGEDKSEQELLAKIAENERRLRELNDMHERVLGLQRKALGLRDH